MKNKPNNTLLNTYTAIVYDFKNMMIYTLIQIY